ncbi:MAG: TatD family hydrolase, partial [Opitutales bacterium]|nr:TatD family hydrolase [Opitutales bacterium]
MLHSTNPMIDTHAHFDHFISDNTVADVILRAKQAGVQKIITCSTCPEDWSVYAKLAKDFPEV